MAVTLSLQWRAIQVHRVIIRTRWDLNLEEGGLSCQQEAELDQQPEALRARRPRCPAWRVATTTRSRRRMTQTFHSRRLSHQMRSAGVHGVGVRTAMVSLKMWCLVLLRNGACICTTNTLTSWEAAPTALMKSCHATGAVGRVSQRKGKIAWPIVSPSGDPTSESAKRTQTSHLALVAARVRLEASPKRAVSPRAPAISEEVT
mmetsp:Transcript_60231/g.105582  ORF Transcript_60231/g.105582 Transcript_60231/m.105582 type:complete len:203 (-) Transcript_60231:812-1420(-)